MISKWISKSRLECVYVINFISACLTIILLVLAIIIGNENMAWAGVAFAIIYTVSMIIVDYFELEKRG